MGVVVFNPWHKVLIKYSESHKKTISEKAFFNNMVCNLESKEYGVYHNSNNQAVTVMYEGREFQVVLPTDAKASIRTGNYNGLVKQLLKLSKETKKIDDKKKAAKEYYERVKEIELSGYSELYDIEDYELYLIYLNELSKTATTEKEKSLIEAKIRGLLKVLTNPFNLSLHFNRLICEVAKKGDTISDERKQELETILKSITDDYYNQIVSSKDQMLVLGSSEKPMGIIRRIVDTELLVEEWATENNKIIAKAKAEKEAKESLAREQEDSELDEISDKLHRMTGSGKR